MNTNLMEKLRAIYYISGILSFWIFIWKAVEVVSFLKRK